MSNAFTIYNIVARFRDSMYQVDRRDEYVAEIADCHQTNRNRGAEDALRGCGMKG